MPTALWHTRNIKGWQRQRQDFVKSLVPSMDILTDDRVRQCHSSLLTIREAHPALVATEDAATSLWTKVSLDFGSFPHGRVMMVITDSYTKYPVVEIISSTAFPRVMLALEKVFAMLGLPEEIKTDNGPPFQGQEFWENLASRGI